MADDSTLSGLDPADPLDGAEISYLVQAGASKQTLLSTIRTWLASTFASGPASSTDNAVVRFDSTSGKLIQDSAVTIADTTGEISGGGLFKSTVSDGASVVGYVLDTTNALSTSGSKLFSLKNFGTEKFYVDKDGNVSGTLTNCIGYSASNLLFNVTTDIGGAVAGTDLILVDKGANGTNRKCTVSRIATYVQSTFTDLQYLQAISLGALL